MLPITVDIRGRAYRNRQVVALRAAPGDSLVLEREYDNLVDQNAVRVVLDAQELGYLPRRVAQLVAPEMDTGLLLTATIAHVERDDVPQVSLVLSADDRGPREPTRRA
jgi:hypothetical protein